jgi:hypothetical protein
VAAVCYGIREGIEEDTAPESNEKKGDGFSGGRQGEAEAAGGAAEFAARGRPSP